MKKDHFLCLHRSNKLFDKTLVFFLIDTSEVGIHPTWDASPIQGTMHTHMHTFIQTFTARLPIQLLALK